MPEANEDALRLHPDYVTTDANAKSSWGYSGPVVSPSRSAM